MTEESANVAGNHYDKYVTSNPFERRMMHGFLGSFDALIADLRPSVVLEVGAGEGRITARLAATFPDAAVIGIDLADGQLAAAWNELGPTMMFADATLLPFPDRSVDLVVGLEMLEHVPTPIAALDDIARVCRGNAILSVPREPIWRIGNIMRGRYVKALGNTPGHVNHWSSGAFRRFVAQRFTIEQTVRPLPWTMIRAVPKNRGLS